MRIVPIVPVLATVLLPAPCPSQPAADAADLMALVSDLGDGERGIDAVRALARRGDAAVQALSAALRAPAFRAEPRRLAAAVYALGKLGPAAVPAAALLLRELPARDDAVARNVFWALGEIGTKAAGGVDVLDALAAHEPASGWARQEWAFAIRRIEVGSEPPTAALVDMLKEHDHATLVAAACVLCRRTAADFPRAELLSAWRRAHEGWQAHGEGWSRVALDLARAVTLHAADTAEADTARAALIRHFDLDVRLEAVLRLGQVPGRDPATAVRALRDALGDGSVRVRREAVTALGMLGPAAAAAAPDLETLAADPDPQLRARAGAALRALRAAK